MSTIHNILYIRRARGLSRRLDVAKNVDLTSHNSLRLPATAAYLVIAHTPEEILAALEFSRRVRLKWIALGGGTNVVFGSQFIDAVLIKLGKEFDFINCSSVSSTIEVGGATPLAKVVDFAVKNKIKGLINFWGIPGTMGGAIAGNAGTARLSICQLLRHLIVLDDSGEIQSIGVEEIRCGYRFCELPGKIILAAELVSQLTTTAEIERELMEIKALRAKQPLLAQEHSAGCIFKNPTGENAGRLIDAAGLKGFSIRGATVSEKHANFIVNRQEATPRDVIELIRLVQTRVKEHFGIWLEPEVKIIGGNFNAAGA